MLLAVNKKMHLNCWNAFFEWNCVENVEEIRESLFRYAMVVVLSRAYGPPKKKIRENWCCIAMAMTRLLVLAPTNLYRSTRHLADTNNDRNKIFKL